TAHAAGIDSVTLSWTPLAGTVGGYIIERSTNGTTWTIAALLSLDVDHYLDHDLVDGTDYQYRISAFNSVGSSGFATADARTNLRAPSNLTAVFQSPVSVQLTWLSGTRGAGYQVYQSGGDDTDWRLVAILPAGINSYPVSGDFLPSTE